MTKYSEINLYAIPDELCKHNIIENDENDSMELNNKRMQRCLLNNLGLKKATFNNCEIRQSVIQDCYLRYASFKNTDFTGSKFINCDLEQAKFTNCTFKYVTFTGCKLNIDELLGCLPYEANLKLRMLKDLRRNEIEMLEKQSADQLLLKEIKVERELLLLQINPKSSYFLEKDSIINRLRAIYKYTLSIIMDLVWGHGLNLTRLLLSGLFITLLFAGLICLSKQQFITGSSSAAALDFWDSLYLSAMAFCTVGYGPFSPSSTYAKIIYSAESFIGAIFISFLAAAVYRRIAK